MDDETSKVVRPQRRPQIIRRRRESSVPPPANVAPEPAELGLGRWFHHPGHRQRRPVRIAPDERDVRAPHDECAIASDRKAEYRGPGITEIRMSAKLNKADDEILLLRRCPQVDGEHPRGDSSRRQVRIHTVNLTAPCRLKLQRHAHCGWKDYPACWIRRPDLLRSRRSLGVVGKSR